MMSRSILSYFQTPNGVPNHRGPLSRTIPSSAIAAANKEVRRVIEESSKSKKRGPYKRYTPGDRAKIGRFASENGVMAAVRKFSQEYERINESTVRNFKKAYHEERSRKRKAGEDAAETVNEVPPKKRSY